MPNGWILGLLLLLFLLQVRLPDGAEGFEPCPPSAPGAQEVNLQYFADKGLADRVVPPTISRNDFEKVLLRARPTVSHSDLGVFEKFTDEFGEEAS
jgi:vacuolar protein-sorting-associated protein 4